MGDLCKRCRVYVGGPNTLDTMFYSPKMKSVFCSESCALRYYQEQKFAEGLGRTLPKNYRWLLHFRDIGELVLKRTLAETESSLVDNYSRPPYLLLLDLDTDEVLSLAEWVNDNWRSYTIQYAQIIILLRSREQPYV